MLLPQYAGASLVNLIAAIVAGRGGSPRHAPLTALPLAALSAPRNVVLLLIDGLGYHYLADVGRGGALHDHLQHRLTSVFPSTTASAITSSFTGATPYEHGLTGWFGWFPEAGVVAAPLPFRRRGDELPLDALGVPPGRIFAVRSVFDDVPARSFVVSPERIVDSTYSTHHCGGAKRSGYAHLSDMVDAIESAVRSSAERKYVYAYYPELDTVAHQHGVASRQAAARLRAIDAAFALLLQRLAGTDTVLVVSADHGFIDTPPDEALRLEDFPQLAALLRLPLTGEPRVAFCHVRSGLADAFMEHARSLLGEQAHVYASATLVAEGWFGGGTMHPHLLERVGDVALVMKGHYTFKDRVAGEKPHAMIGNHGGITAAEMEVPLVLARV